MQYIKHVHTYNLNNKVFTAGSAGEIAMVHLDIHCCCSGTGSGTLADLPVQFGQQYLHLQMKKIETTYIAHSMNIVKNRLQSEGTYKVVAIIWVELGTRNTLDNEIFF